MKQRVLVTGSAGYIGCVMTETLQAHGHEAVGLDIRADLPTECACPTYTGDVRDLSVDDLEGYHAVVHLAWLQTEPFNSSTAEQTAEANFEASVQMAARAKEAGVKRFLFASTCVVYGAAGSGKELPRGEASRLQPATPDVEAKVRAEAAIRELASDDFSPVVLRNAGVYGASPRLRSDLLLNNLVACAHAPGVVRILSDELAWRTVVHVRDLCQAYAAVLEANRERSHGQTFNVGRASGNYQLRQLAETVRAVVPRCEIEYAGQNHLDARGFRVDFSKFQAAFPEFHPQWDARRGAQELYAWYRENEGGGETPQQFPSEAVAA